MTEIIVFFGTILVSLLMTWFLVFRPFFNMQKYLSISIVNDLVPDIKSSHEHITTLSASAILLSFTVLQFVEKKPITELGMIKISWTLFGAAILFGVLAGVTLYILKAQSAVFVKSVSDHFNVEPMSKDLLKQMFHERKRQLTMLLGLLLVQLIFFVSGIAFLITFAKNNLS